MWTRSSCHPTLANRNLAKNIPGTEPIPVSFLNVNYLFIDRERKNMWTVDIWMENIYS